MYAFMAIGLAIYQLPAIFNPPANLSTMGSVVLSVLAGLGIVMGMFYPANEPTFVTTPAWIIVHIFATSLGFFGVLGLAGLYARQVEKAGWLGLIGFLVFSAWMALVGMLSFIEAALLPLLADEFQSFVVGFLGMFSSSPSQVNLGVLPVIWTIKYMNPKAKLAIWRAK